MNFKEIKDKVMDVLFLGIAALAILLGFKVVIEEPKPEKIVFYSVDPASVEQETDSYTVPD